MSLFFMEAGYLVGRLRTFFTACPVTIHQVRIVEAVVVATSLLAL